MSKHRANVPPRTHPEQPPGRHRAETPPVAHWYPTCVEVREADSLAMEPENITCETCLLQRRQET